MVSANEDRPIRGFVFACGKKTEVECFDRLLFGSDRVFGPVVIRIRNGDLLFLHNLETDVLYGVFEASSDGNLNIQKDAWKGRYPYQVKVKSLGERTTIKNAKRILRKFEFKRSTPMFGKRLIEFLRLFIPNTTLLQTKMDLEEQSTAKLILEKVEKIKRKVDEVDIEPEIPQVEATTLWDFPRQSYGLAPKGDNKYPGVTPALIIFNLIWRYTNPGDLIVDPMCGSGTTIDVCKEEKRRVMGYDISSVRADIIQNDARKIPLDDGTVDLIFIDSPYSDKVLLTFRRFELSW